MPNIGRSLRRAIRPLWIAGLGAAAWSNRAKVQYALGLKVAPTPATPASTDSVTVFATTAVIEPTVVVPSPEDTGAPTSIT